MFASHSFTGEIAVPWMERFYVKVLSMKRIGCHEKITLKKFNDMNEGFGNLTDFQSLL
jgi:hypothetical protein